MDIGDEVSELQLRALLAATPLAVAACDAEGWLTLLSPAMQELVGPFERIHASQFVKRFDLRDQDGHHPLRTEELPLVRALRGEVVRETLLTARAEQRMVFMRTSAAPVRTATGQLLGAVAVVQDVTPAETAARERDRLRARLMETVNHEFRTPLAKLQGHVEILLDEAEQLPAPVRRSLEVIGRATHDLATLVRTVSELSDLEAYTRLSRKRVDLPDLLGEVVEDARRFLPRCGGGVVLEAPSHLIALVDPAKLKRALLELVHNAAIYGPPDTDVVLRLTAQDDEVVVSVIDAGPGIAPTEWPRLIQPFERGEHPHQAVNNKGLGLAIAHSVAATHAGNLTFEARTDGFAATLRLPARDRL